MRVDRGSVRVVDRKRKPLARLEAGGTWSPTETTKPTRPVGPTLTPHPTVDELGHARSLFAAKEYEEAELVAEKLAARALSRSEAAETRMFLADVAQASGKLEVAALRYGAVATDFADLAAGESALYAAARVELRRGRKDAARALFARYLDRYPNGRYADDVRRQHPATP